MSTAATLFRRNPDVACNEVPDGYVVYDPQRDEVHYLNLTAAAVLELCDGETDSAAIAQSMQVAFGLPQAPKADVEACLQSLATQGLIVPIGGHLPSA